MQRIKQVLAFGATDTSKSFKIFENGVIPIAYLVLPDFTTGTPTAVLSVEDTDSVQIYASASQAENGTRLLTSLTIPVDKGFTAKVTLSGQPGGAHNVTVVLFVENRR